MNDIFYGNYYASVNYSAYMKYLINFYIKNKVFYNKLKNKLDVKKFKSLYISKAIIIVGLVLINYYKKRTLCNKNFATTEIDIVNIYDDNTDQVDI